MSDDPQLALVNRLFEASLGTGEVFTVYLGDRLGFYRALLDGARTAAELAGAAETDARATREWLEQQAAAGILSVQDVSAPPEQRRFSLPEANAEALTDPDSPYSIAPLCRSFAAIGTTLPKIVDAFRTGEGVSWEDYGRDMIEAQGDFNRPWLRGSLATEYLPSIQDIHERLSAGATVADVACGVGWAGISIAQAYPNVTVDGFDLDEPSITLARANAAEAGVADRVNHSVEDVGDLLLDGVYDLAIVVEAIHDLSAPVEVLDSIRRMLTAGGTLIVADEKTEDAFTAPASETERLFYTYSVLCCLISAQVDDPTAATGTVMRRSTFEGYAKDAGFSSVEVLPIEHDFLRFYRLNA
ncbi:MAG TPA: class I SAM-dependent methyltransferase [Actinomycetota bacterium]